MISEIAKNELEAPMLDSEQVPEMLQEWGRKKRSAEKAKVIAKVNPPLSSVFTVGLSLFGTIHKDLPTGLLGLASGMCLGQAIQGYAYGKIYDFEEFCKKIPYSVSLFPRLVLAENSTSYRELFNVRDKQSWIRFSNQNDLAKKDYLESGKLINSVRNWATNWDLLYETGDGKYRGRAGNESRYLKENCGKRFGEGFAEELSGLEAELLEFFPYEKELWASVQSGTPPTGKDIRRYVDMRGADSKYHARIIGGYTGKDFSEPLHTWMRLADLDNDLYQLESDIAEGKPNVAVMYTAQKMRSDKITASDVKALGHADRMIASIKEDLVGKIKDFDYGKSVFLIGELQKIYNPAPRYVPVR